MLRDWKTELRDIQDRIEVLRRQFRHGEREFEDFKDTLDIVLCAMSALNEMNGDALEAITKYLGLELVPAPNGTKWIIKPKES